MRILITGASRGIGLEVTRQYLARGERLFATCRDPQDATDLLVLSEQRPDLLTVLPLDVTDQATIALAYHNVRRYADGLDVLVNNAGVYPEGERLGKIDREGVRHTFDTNAVGPLVVAQTFLDLLKGGTQPKLVNISSEMGSISQRRHGGYYSYCASKAALNMLTRLMAFELRSKGITTISMHPGWVKTDMGGPGASLDVDEAVRGMIAVIDGLAGADSGRFLQWDGRELPW
jgi:NAD(P)-dependent dehydrogenase (short-subunit alcohol dehydrogenase family)